MTKKIGFCGLPSTGKTLLARMVATQVRNVDYIKNVELVSEYARRYISKHSNPTELWEQFRITSKQIEWEESVINPMLDLMITDGPIFLALAYAMDILEARRNDGTYFLHKEKDDMIFHDLMKTLTKANSSNERYDIIFYLSPHIVPQDDGVRAFDHLDPVWREKMDRRIKVIFEDLYPPKKLILVPSVEPDDKLDFCMNHILEMFK